MPDEYISRAEAVKIAEKYGLANGSAFGRHTGLADCIASEISGLPAADVAEVVRCRDCINYIGSMCFRCGLGHEVSVDADDFCSRGVTE